MATLSERDEQLLLNGVSRTAELVNEGYSSVDAMAKTAKELGYTPGFLRVACNAFNTGRQNTQWNQGDSILDKLASVELVDYDSVHEKLWPSKPVDSPVKSAGANIPLCTYEDVRRGWRMDGPEFKAVTEKAATVATVEAPEHVKSAAEKEAKFRNLRALQRRMEQARTEKAAAENRFNLPLHQLYSYFRKPTELRASLSSVKEAAVTYRGENCELLFDFIAERIPEKFRSGGYVKLATSWKEEPYCYVDKLLETGEALAKASAEYEDLLQQYSTLYDELHTVPKPFQPYQKAAAEIDLGLFKSAAGILGGVLSAGAFGATRSTLDALRDREDKKLEQYVGELDSPDHLDNLRKIRAQTFLTEMMMDPDNPISGYDPDQVAHEYNNLVQLSPRLADQPSVISSLLNKRLAGNTEPFELAETLKLEEGLKKTQAPVREGSNAT